MRINALLDMLMGKGVHLELTSKSDIKVRITSGKLDASTREAISKNKDDIVHWLKRNKEINVPDLICHGDILDGELIESTFSQESLFITDELHTGTRAYNMPASIKIKGQLNSTSMSNAVDSLVDRHSILRTVFKKTDKGVFQVISDKSKPKLFQIDISELGGQIRARKLKALTELESNYHFSLSEGPLFRVALIKLDNNSHVLLINIHHILTDGASQGILTAELWHLYSDYLEGDSHSLAALPFQYVDYAIWQKKRLQGVELEKQQTFWLNQLKGAPSLSTFPSDHYRPSSESHKGGRFQFSLSVNLTQKISSLTKKSGVTLFMTLFSAFNILLYRYSGQRDIVVGTPISNRNHPGLDKLIGYFVNMLAIRSRFSPENTFTDILQLFKENALQAYKHQDMPFEKVVELINPKRSVSYSPLFQTTFSLHEFTPSKYQTPDLELSYLEMQSYTTRFDLSLDMYKSGDQLQGSVEYSSDLFEPTTIQRMIESFTVLLESIVENPNLSCEHYPIVPKTESEKLLVEWNDTLAPFPKDKTVCDLFEEQVELTPDKVALVFDEQNLTYRQLNSKANQLAHYLINRGLKPDALVAICVERSLAMVVGLLGILKAGGTYLPLDPDYPQARLVYMLENSEAGFLLSESPLKDLLADYNGFSVYLDSHLNAISVQSTDNPTIDNASNCLMYLIYTSGSTGQPKGVIVEHRNIVNFLYAMTLEPGLSSDDVFCAVTSMSFDIHVLEIYLPLVQGACLILAGKDSTNNPDMLKLLLDRHKVTAMQATPATYKMLLTSGWQVNDKLKVLVGGEKLSKDLSNQLLAFNAIELWNMYGPTETSVWSCVEQKVLGQQDSTIGRPIANTQVYILDGQQACVPIGVAGELYIAGEGVTGGYFNQPEISEQQFKFNHLNDSGSRLYKTGDLCKYLADGTIQYLGRLDDQVKLRGFRIELGEVESAIRLHPQVNDCIVLIRGDSEDDKHLVAYVASVNEVAANTLKELLGQRLPNYMIPATFIHISSIPLMDNGKVDRNALPDLERLLSNQDYVAPITEVEKLLVKLWADVLNINIDILGITDDFFEVGGHSLSATKVVALIRKNMKVDVPLRKLFELPTVKQLSKYVDALPKQIVTGIVKIPRVERSVAAD